MSGQRSGQSFSFETLESRQLLSTVFLETFEGQFPGSAWTILASQGRQWDQTQARAYTGLASAHCAETALGETTGDYVNSMTSAFQRTVSLAGLPDARLSFAHWTRSEANYDFLRVLVNGSTVWSTSGDSNGWQVQQVDLGAFAGMSQVTIRFEFRSDMVNTDVGSYVDDIALTTTRDDNDTLATAAGLAVGSNIDELAIAPSTDVQLFAVDVLAGQRLAFDVDIPAGSQLDSYLRLFDGNGNPLESNENAAGLDAYLEYQFAAAGRYYLGVSNNVNTAYNPVTGAGDFAGGTTGIYTLLVDEIDADDTIGEAVLTPMGMGGAAALASPTDVDMFAVVVDAGQQIGFDIDRTPGSLLDSYLRIFDAQGNVLAENDNAAGPAAEFDASESYLRHTFAAAGTYYVGVSTAANRGYDPLAGSGDQAGVAGGYRLTITQIDTDDQLGEAAGLLLGDTIPGEIKTATDVDLYGFDVPAGATVKIDLDLAAGSNLNSLLRLFDSSGRQVAVNDNAAGPAPERTASESYVEYVAAAAGRYYAGVSNSLNGAYDPIHGEGDAAGGSTGEYILNVFTGTQADVDDPDNEVSEATIIEVGTPIDADIASPTDIDVFGFFATQGQRIGFDLDLENGLWDPYLRLMDSQGNELLASDDMPGPDPEFSAMEPYLAHSFTVPGMYYLAVSLSPSSPSSDTGQYTLNLVQIQAGQPAPPTAFLAHPAKDGSIYIDVANTTERYIDVTFVDRSGMGLNAASILDAEAEFALSGSALNDTTISNTPIQLEGTTFRYPLGGQFVPGQIQVSFLADSYSDRNGSNNDAAAQTFTVNVRPQAPDRIAPVSAAAATANGTQITITWQGQDETDGANLTYDVYYAIDGGQALPLYLNTTLTTGTLTGQPGRTYGFYSVASDQSGNREAPPVTFDATVSLVGGWVYQLSPANPTLVLTDSNFNTVGLTWVGPGTVDIMQLCPPNVPAGSAWRGDIDTIVINGSTANSSLYVSTLGGPTRIRSITVNGTMNALVAGTAIVAEEAAFTGSLNQLILGGVQNGAIAIGPRAAGQANLLYASLGAVSEASLTSQTPISVLNAASWTDAAAPADTLQAPYIGVLNVAGNFGPNVTLTGQDARGSSLGYALVGGQVTGGQWQAPGTLEYLAAGSTAAPWAMDFAGRANVIVAGSLAGAMRAAWFNAIVSRGALAADISTSAVDPGGNSIGSLVAYGAAGDSTIDVDGNIGLLQAASWAGGAVAANRIGQAFFTGGVGLGGSVGFNLTLGGFGTSVGYFSTAGTLTGGLWTMNGSITTLAFGGSAAPWQANLLGGIGTLIARGTMAGQLEALSVGTFYVIGDMSNLVTNLTQATGTAVNVFYVTGWMNNSQLNAAASVTAAYVGGMKNNSRIFLGVLGGVNQLPAAGQFSTQARLGAFVLTGAVAENGASMIASNVAAWTIGSAYVRNAAATTTGVNYGLAADSFTSCYYSGPTATVWRTNVTAAGNIVTVNDFIVRVI